MSDTAYPVFEHYGTNAARLAFTPAPASGTQPIYVWYETDTNLVYIYTTAWKGPYAYLPSGYTTGDLLLGSGSNAVSRLAIGANTYVLTSNGTTAAWAAPGGGGGGAWTNITGSVTVTGATVSGGVASVVTPGNAVTFSSIPGTYNHLKLTFMLRMSDSALTEPFGAQFNGDTASNYDQVKVQNTTTSTASAQAQMNLGNLPAATATANVAGSGEMLIPNYAGTTFYKTCLGQSGYLETLGTTSTYFNTQFYNLWRSTSAITSIKVFDFNGGNLVAGSTFSLYGIT